MNQGGGSRGERARGTDSERQYNKRGELARPAAGMIAANFALKMKQHRLTLFGLPGSSNRIMYAICVVAFATCRV